MQQNAPLQTGNVMSAANSCTCCEPRTGDRLAVLQHTTAAAPPVCACRQHLAPQRGRQQQHQPCARLSPAHPQLLSWRLSCQCLCLVGPTGTAAAGQHLTSCQGVLRHPAAAALAMLGEGCAGHAVNMQHAMRHSRRSRKGQGRVEHKESSLHAMAMCTHTPLHPPNRGCLVIRLVKLSQGTGGKVEVEVSRRWHVDLPGTPAQLELLDQPLCRVDAIRPCCDVAAAVAAATALAVLVWPPPLLLLGSMLALGVCPCLAAASCCCCWLPGLSS